MPSTKTEYAMNATHVILLAQAQSMIVSNRHKLNVTIN